jgi:mannose-6-phosphate isomerase-like protein (cupin superfamily)
MKRYTLNQLDEIDPLRCPCGWTRRGFVGLEDSPVTVHLVTAETDARTHYHRKLTEIYIVLEGDGFLELDGEKVPIRPLSAIMIRPGCRHRAVGRMKFINVAIPAFDPADEWFD